MVYVYLDVSNGDGSHAKTYVGGFNILNAKRKNIYKYIKEEYRSDCIDNPVALTQLIIEPKYLFDFENFRKLFIRCDTKPNYAGYL